MKWFIVAKPICGLETGDFVSSSGLRFCQKYIFSISPRRYRVWTWRNSCVEIQEFSYQNNVHAWCYHSIYTQWFITHYSHIWCFDGFFCVLVMVIFTHTLQDYFIVQVLGTLPRRMWLNQSQQFTNKRWYNHNKTNQNKTVCIFHGIYCRYYTRGGNNGLARGKPYVEHWFKGGGSLKTERWYQLCCPKSELSQLYSCTMLCAPIKMGRA